MKTQYPVDKMPATRPELWSRAGIVCGAILLFAGCESEPESHVVSAPPPPPPAMVQPVATTQTTTTTTPSGQTITTQTQPVYVTQAPPAVQTEVVLARPGPEYAWVPGYWTWRDSRYEWMAGHWEIPPRSSAVWVPPHWDQESGGYRFYEGYWN
jgi:hypothetical protein